ncbi:DUF3572 domain-containing protein [Mesorhizobium sp. Z1-4]|uniref:DUF3572 domain-containing protein n=1 Tax=Mesorhizobium sp. Z1-4 TaxID=2448478 RepID=UPI000FD7A8C1|nr:DUF3572 domain-containing protein [Mesorhizobium sp. Z1-4]
MGNERQNSATARAAAEAIAVEALAFIASDEKLLPRFLAITGIEASEIRRAAATPGFLAGVLQFIAAHEPTLMQFAEASGHNPAAVTKAIGALPFGADNFDRSV